MAHKNSFECFDLQFHIPYVTTKWLSYWKYPYQIMNANFNLHALHGIWDKVVKNVWKFQLLEKKVRTIFFCVSAKNDAPCKKIMDLSPASGTDSISIERITLQMEWISTPNRLNITPIAERIVKLFIFCLFNFEPYSSMGIGEHSCQQACDSFVHTSVWLL